MCKGVELYKTFLDYKIFLIKKFTIVYRALCEFDNIIIPSMSQRDINIKEYSKKIYKNAMNFIVIKDNFNVGFMSIYVNNKKTNEAYISQIVIKNEFQNKGIGSYLLNECVNISKEKNMEYIKLEVFISNIKAIDIYKKNGFSFYNKASDKSIYMIKNLNTEVIEL